VNVGCNKLLASEELLLSLTGKVFYHATSMPMLYTNSLAVSLMLRHC